MRVLEIPYRAYVLLINRIAAFSSKLSLKTRAGLMEMAVFCLSFLGIIAYSSERIKELLHYEKWVFFVSALLMVMLLIASIDRKITLKHTDDTRPLFWIGWYLCFLMISVSSLVHYVWDAYCLMGVLCLSVFPMLMIIWHERNDLSRLYILIARNMVLVSYVFLLINILLVAFITNNEFTDLGYLGITANQNSNGLIVLPFFTSALYLLLTDRKYSYYYLFSLAICVMFVYISKTRTAEMAIFLEALIAIIICIRHRSAFSRAVSAKKMITAVIVVTIITIVIGFGLQHLDRVDMNSYALSEIEEASAEVNANENLIILNRLSNGRLILWKAYLKKVEFKGHGNPKGALFEGYDYSRWAHNNALDIWYASGFMAFAGYVLWILSAWVFVIRCMVSKKGFRKEHLLTALAFVGYFVEAMLEITIYPMYTGIAFLAFAAMAPIAFKE